MGLRPACVLNAEALAELEQNWGQSRSAARPDLTPILLTPILLTPILRISTTILMRLIF